jgi:hypothetical protein
VLIPRGEKLALAEPSVLETCEPTCHPCLLLEP